MNNQQWRNGRKLGSKYEHMEVEAFRFPAIDALISRENLLAAKPTKPILSFTFSSCKFMG